MQGPATQSKHTAQSEAGILRRATGLRRRRGGDGGGGGAPAPDNSVAGFQGGSASDSSARS